LKFDLGAGFCVGRASRVGSAVEFSIQGREGTLGRYEREQFSVDEVGMGRAHAVRQFLVDFKFAVLQQFR
jgi:hypothetical protein